MARVNKSLLCAVLLIVGAVGYSRTIDPPYEVGTWRGFRQAAISFTLDDGCPNQFVIAIPMFNNFGFRLTLFTITGQSPNWTALQTAACQGYEVASHTVTHPSLSGMTLAQQTAELKNSQDDINAHIAGQRCVTLAYPYCATGNEPLCAQYYIAARGCQGFIEASTPGDFMNISSLICGNLGSVRTAADFNVRFENAAAARGWCVLLIHGIDNDGGYSPLPSGTLKACLEYLDARRGRFWVATFGSVARYVRERNAVSITESASQDGRINLHVTDTLDNAIYGDPVTLRRPLPEGWASAHVSQNGQTADAWIVEVNSRKYVMFDAVPDGGDVVLSKAPAVPVGLTATAGHAAVGLDWNDNNDMDVAGYNVYRSPTSGSGYSRLNSSVLGSSNYDDAGIPHDATCFYVVTAVDVNSTESSYSTEASSGLYGDVTGNHVVEMDDLSGFCEFWLETDCHATAGLDLDDDCIVSFHEFAVLAKNWLHSPYPLEPPTSGSRR